MGRRERQLGGSLFRAVRIECDAAADLGTQLLYANIWISGKTTRRICDPIGVKGRTCQNLQVRALASVTTLKSSKSARRETIRIDLTLYWYVSRSRAAGASVLVLYRTQGELRGVLPEPASVVRLQYYHNSAGTTMFTSVTFLNRGTAAMVNLLRRPDRPVSAEPG